MASGVHGGGWSFFDISRPVGNLWHHPQSELSEDVAWVTRLGRLLREQATGR